MMLLVLNNWAQVISQALVKSSFTKKIKCVTIFAEKVRAAFLHPVMFENLKSL